MFLEMQVMEPFNMRMIKLKPDADMQGIMRFLAVKDKIKTPILLMSHVTHMTSLWPLG